MNDNLEWLLSLLVVVAAAVAVGWAALALAQWADPANDSQGVLALIIFFLIIFSACQIAGWIASRGGERE